MRSHWFILLLFVSGILVQQRCHNPGESNDNAKEQDTVKQAGIKKKDSLLFKTWFHSFEDDKGDTLVYRPDSYDFPLSRGRDGFRIEKGGSWTGYRIGRADRPEEVEGSWNWKGRDTVKIHFEHKDYSSYYIRFFKVTDSLLKLKKWTGKKPGEIRKK